MLPRVRASERLEMGAHTKFFDPSSSDDDHHSGPAAPASRRSVLLLSRDESEFSPSDSHLSREHHLGTEGERADSSTASYGTTELAGPQLTLAAAAEWRAPALAFDGDSSRVDFSRLHHQLIALSESASPTAAQQARTSAALSRIELSVKRALPGCRITLFGSNASHLALPDSDLDLVAITAAHASAQESALAAELRKRMDDESGGRTLNGRQRRREVAIATGAIRGGLSAAARKELLKPLRMVMRRVIRDGIASRDPSVRPEVIKAKVPIVKFVEARSGIPVDLCVDTTNGTVNSAWIRSALERRPQLRPLVLVLKVLLRRHGLQDTYTGGIGSYLLFAMADKAFDLANVPPRTSAVHQGARVHCSSSSPSCCQGESDIANNARSSLRPPTAHYDDISDTYQRRSTSYDDLGLLLIEVLERFVNDEHFCQDGANSAREGGGQGGRGRYRGRRRRVMDEATSLKFEDPQNRGSDIGCRAFRWSQVAKLFQKWLDLLKSRGCLSAILPGWPTDASSRLTSSQITRLARPLQRPSTEQLVFQAEPMGQGLRELNNSDAQLGLRNYWPTWSDHNQHDPMFTLSQPMHEHNQLDNNDSFGMDFTDKDTQGVVGDPHEDPQDCSEHSSPGRLPHGEALPGPALSNAMHSSQALRGTKRRAFRMASADDAAWRSIQAARAWEESETWKYECEEEEVRRERARVEAGHSAADWEILEPERKRRCAHSIISASLPPHERGGSRQAARRFPCAYCKKVFASNFALGAHVMAKHKAGALK